MTNGTERERLDHEVSKAWSGDPWHGSPLTAILDGIDAAGAAARPIADAHTIWELVLHMTGWTNEVVRRLEGNEPGQPPDGDWPEVTDRTDAAWSAAKKALGDAHDRLRAVVRALPEEKLFVPPREARSRPDGTGVTSYELVHGLVQHDAYHAGQIALLRKFATR